MEGQPGEEGWGPLPPPPPPAASPLEGENIAPWARAKSTSVWACLASPFSVPETKSMVSPVGRRVEGE